MDDAQHPREQERGFALISILGLLLIVTALGTYVFARSAEEEDLRVEGEINARLQTVRMALISYAWSTPGSTVLPCPDLDGDGIGDPETTDVTTPPLCTPPAAGALPAIPYRELALARTESLDPWRRPILYAISGLTVTTDTGPETGLDFVLVSTGENTVNGTTAAEGENLDNDTTFAIVPFGQDGFDDRLEWGTFRRPGGGVLAQTSWANDVGSFVASGDSDTNKDNPAAPAIVIDTSDPASPVVQMDGPANGGTARSCFYGPDQMTIEGAILRAYFEVSFQEDTPADNKRGEGMTFLLLPQTATDAFGVQATAAADLQCGEARHLGYFGSGAADASGAGALARYKIGVELDTRPSADDITVHDPDTNHIAILRKSEHHSGRDPDDLGFDGPACRDDQQAVADLDRDAPPVHGCWARAQTTWLEEGHDAWSKVRVEVRHFQTETAALAAGCTPDPVTGIVDAIRVDAWLWEPNTACAMCDDLTRNITAADNDATTRIWHCLPYSGTHQRKMWYGFSQGSTGTPDGSENSQPWIRGLKIRNEKP